MHTKLTKKNVFIGEQNELNEEYFGNIYTGQRGPLALDISNVGGQVRGCLQYRGPVSLPQPEIEGPQWKCHMCTFQNHPLLNKCEQCDMPRILHGTQQDTAAPDPNVAFSMVRPLGDNGPYVPNAAFNTNPAGLTNNQPANLNVMNRTYPINGFPGRSLSPQVASPPVLNNYNGLVHRNIPFNFPSSLGIPTPASGVVFRPNRRSSPNRPEQNRTHRPIPHI